MTFSVEIANSEELSSHGHHVEIYLDKEAMTSLISRLSNQLANSEESEHIHLMSSSWGLGDLTESVHHPNNEITHHLKIILTEPKQ